MASAATSSRVRLASMRFTMPFSSKRLITGMLVSMWVLKRFTSDSGLSSTRPEVLAALQATFRHHLLRALQKQDEMQLRITLLMIIHMHLVSDELVPALQILHAAGESVDDNLLLALSFVEADLLQKQINRDFTRNNQPLLDVVVDELSVLASATTERLEKCLPLLLLAETVSSADGDPAKLLLQSGGHGSLS